MLALHFIISTGVELLGLHFIIRTGGELLTPHSTEVIEKINWWPYIIARQDMQDAFYIDIILLECKDQCIVGKKQHE